MSQYPNYYNSSPIYSPQNYDQYGQQQRYAPMMHQQQQYMQQMSAIPQYQTIVGRFIGNQAEIMPKEIPMDGSVSLFPVNDMSMIYAKAWEANGTIKTVIYKPVIDEQADSMDGQKKVQYEPSEGFTQGIMERFDRLEKLMGVKQTAQAKKKEVENE